MRVRIIPCLDILQNRVVKGRRFQNLIDLGNPIEMCRKYCDGGADELVILNIGATIGGSPEEFIRFCRLINSMAQQIHVPLTVGGGINSVQKARALLNAGADKVSLNSSALSNAPLIRNIANCFGSQCIIAAADVTKNIIKNKWEVCSYSGSLQTGIDINKWASDISYCGAGEILLTSMDHDGTLGGFDLSLVSLVRKHSTLPIIASGGGGCCFDCAEIMKLGEASAVLLASILHSNQRDVTTIKSHSNIVWGSY
ncbi:imidazole glycerol phosphate synthase subunit HisF [Candidatus Tremblaya phenacola PAVE]|nr:imidazole glycerol phosphate synthase subunit HisF [Candidatus Tremblaya phenacola PAVE]